MKVQTNDHNPFCGIHCNALASKTIRTCGSTMRGDRSRGSEFDRQQQDGGRTTWFWHPSVIPSSHLLSSAASTSPAASTSSATSTSSAFWTYSTYSTTSWTSAQDFATCWSLGVGLRGNGERMRKWRGNEGRMRKWRRNGVRFSKFPHSLSVPPTLYQLPIPKLVTFCRKM